MAAVASSKSASPARDYPCLRGGALRQFQLVPSGSQGWFSRTVGGGGDHFAYASTLALYVYRLSDFTLSSVLTGHQRTITGLAWNHRNPSQFVSLASDAKLVLWDVVEGKQLLSKSVSHNAFVADFNTTNPDKVAFACEDKAVYLWDTRENTVKRLFRTGKTSARCLRWSERKSNILAVGNKNGQILLHNTSNNSTIELMAGGPEASPVADIRWDRLSADYLLVAFRDGTLILIDVETRGEVQRFEKQGAAITALEWLPRQPGAFASINGRAGVIRIWNVSQRAPLEVIKVSDKPAFGMSLLPDGHSLAMTFLDGAVAIYDTATRAMRHRGLPGHIETIFDVAFHPLDADTLATASYDASVKVWNAPSMRCAQTLTADTGPLYSVSWSSDGSKIVASSGKGRTAVWDVCTGTVLWLNSAAHKATSLRVDWSVPGPQKLVTSGMDKTLAVWDTEHKRLVTRISHPGDVMGCAWSPVDPELIATACADGQVRLYSFRSSRPVLEVRAHSGRAFNIRFSPIMPSLIASTGDDGNVAIIDVTTAALTKLHGHKDKVRALCWHPEFHGIVISGGWDGLICVFDTVAGTCLQSHRAHDADIYGLSVHPLRPFTAVSSSRDTSLRFWHLTPPSSAHRAMVLLVLADPCLLESFCKDASSLPSSHTAPPMAAPIGFWGQGSKAAVAAIKAALGLNGDAGDRLAPSSIDWGSPPSSPASDGLARAKVYAAVGSLLLDADGAVDMWRLVVRAAEAKAGIPASESQASRGQSLGGTGRAGTGTSSTTESASASASTSASGAGSIVGGKRDPKALRALFGGVGANGDGAGGDAAATAGAALPPEVGDGLRLGSGVPPVLWCEDAAAASAERALRADAVRLGMASTGLGGPSEAEFMASAARLYLQQGNIRRYCDVLIATGRWDEALAVAPAAGLSFWRELTAKRATMLASDGTSSALPFLVATGDVDGAAELLVSRSEGDAAVAMQQAVATGAWDAIIRVTATALRDGMDGTAASSSSSAGLSGAGHGDGLSSASGSAFAPRRSASTSSAAVRDDIGLARQRAATRRDTTARKLADQQFARGSACRAAAQALSVGDSRLAVQFLERGGLQLMAFTVARALDVRPRLSLAIAMAKLMQREGLWRESLQMLVHERCPAVDVAMMAAQFGQPEATAAAAVAATVVDPGAAPEDSGIEDMTTSLYEDCAIRNRSSWEKDTAGLISAGRHVEAVACLVASRKFAAATVAGLRVMRILLMRGDWDASKLRRLADILAHCDATNMPPRRRARLVAYSALVGGLTAVDRGSLVIASALFRVFRRMVQGHELQGVGVSIARVACIEARALLGQGQGEAAIKLLKAHGKPLASAATGGEHSTATSDTRISDAASSVLANLPTDDEAGEDEDEEQEAEIAKGLLEQIHSSTVLAPPSEYDDDDLVRRLQARAEAVAKNEKGTTQPHARIPCFVPEGSKLPRAGYGLTDGCIGSEHLSNKTSSAGATGAGGKAASASLRGRVSAADDGTSAPSVISGLPVRGLRVQLAAEGQCSSLAEALEWAACCAFSPLADGSKAYATME